ncbi:hypothetical protein [Methylovirgula sp. HY1]|uniref:hypothetical protein n=1 Tax=Methylovirgula sp. HY1 TaxID=2822761 RepID=UPI001C5AE429|nr:hypothetical protein [Methylovirgula sp. HY1]QXX74235.1 hypothetical protein MHY1_01045 [Methylovirgula sp. HY1]
MRDGLHLTTEEIDATEWWVVEQQFDYWTVYPPLNVLLMALHGVKITPPELTEAEEAKAIEVFKARKPAPGYLSFAELEAIANRDIAKARAKKA